MMTDEDFLRRLREAFAIEADEHLQAITSGLLALEKSPADEETRQLVETTFRQAHSLKGAARAVNRSDIEAVCQALEGVFSHWKNGQFQAGPDAFDVLNRARDAVARLLAMPDVSSEPSERALVSECVAEVDGLLATSSLQPPSAVARPEPPPAPPAVSAAPSPVAAPNVPPAGELLRASETVRIPIAKMDALLLRAEEMVTLKIAAARNSADLREACADIEAWGKGFQKAREARYCARPEEHLAQLIEFTESNHEFLTSLGRRFRELTRLAEEDERMAGALVDDLLGDTKRLAMLPFASLLDAFPKQVRDLSRDQGKEIDLEVRGREIEIDKRILEEMKDPLIHLVRNAVDHGIETPQIRQKRGKPERAHLRIAVAQVGDKVEIIVSDDGGGIDLDRVRESAVHAGAVTTEEAEQLDDRAAVDLIFRSGVSSSAIITDLSGRGLGMAIVREKVEKLGGRIAVNSVAGEGTRFQIILPLTIATFKGVLVAAGGQNFVIPVSNIERIARFHPHEVKSVEGREVVALDGRSVSLARLDDLLGLPSSGSLAADGFVEVIVLEAIDKRIAFAVDSVLDEREVLVKRLAKPLGRVRNIAAATVLASGTPVLILNVADLLKSAASGAASRRVETAEREAETAGERRILVVDDSLTSRMLLKNILGSAGYSVETSVDGAAAWAALQERSFELVVSDVEMPRLNGFELTMRIRADERFAELPVVLVTALGSRDDQERGIEAGANAYIVKSSFDQGNLLDVIRKLIGAPP